MVRKNWLLFLILVGAAFLRLFRLPELMPFIGDQGWFYVSAKDMVTSGTIPLVGITSSHTWLHQGPLWTYILSAIFLLFNFHPLAPAYFSAVFGVITVFVSHQIVSRLFSKKAGLITATFFAFSPLIIIHSRMPYHISPIPLLVLFLLYSIYQWIKGSTYYFPLVIFLLALLYNFELATQILWSAVVVVFILGILRKESYARSVLTKRILLWSFIAFIAPMIPIIIYDMTHGFPQTIKFALWIGYTVVKFFLPHKELAVSYGEIGRFFLTYNSRIVFLGQTFIAATLSVTSLLWFLLRTITLARQNKLKTEYLLLLLFTFVPFFGFILTKTPSEAYLPTLYPGLLITTSLFFSKLAKGKLTPFIAASLIVIVITNSYLLISRDYLMGKYSGYGYTFTDRLDVTKKIIEKAEGRKYNLVIKDSKYESDRANYEYLTWWLGNPPSLEKQSLKFVIKEEPVNIEVKIMNETIK